jgi:hypothetical protein
MSQQTPVREVLSRVSATLTAALIVSALVSSLPAVPAGAQAPMTCQLGSGADSAKCSVFHYHVQVYDPSKKARVELTGVNEFASQAACEAELGAAQAHNQALVKFMTTNVPRQKFQPDVFGPCHCDMTRSASSPNRLDPNRRVAELRMQQEIIAETREILLDAGVLETAPSVLAGLKLAPSSFDPALWPKIVFAPDPATMKIEPLPIPETESMQTSVADLVPRGNFGAALDLELIDVPTPKNVMVASTSARADAPAEESERPAASASDDANPADAFVSFESSRVQAILQASSGIDDAAVKKRIFESAMQRLQVLSNLKVIVLAAGTSSRLADAFRNLDTDDQRAALMGRLFGSDVQGHWVPSDARDVILDIPPELTGDPIAVLRESTGRYDDEQRKQALYYALGRTANLTPSQELWIAELMSSFL